MKTLWGFDLDDVLCLTPSWRTPFKQTKKLWVQVPSLQSRWPGLFVVDADLQAFIGSLRAAGYRIAIVTARRPWCRQATTAWLERNGIVADHIAFKPAIEKRSTARYKVDTVHQLGCHVFVDDDRRNVEALRTLAGCRTIHWSFEHRQTVLAELAALRKQFENPVL